MVRRQAAEEVATGLCQKFLYDVLPVLRRPPDNPYGGRRNIRMAAAARAYYGRRTMAFTAQREEEKETGLPPAGGNPVMVQHFCASVFFDFMACRAVKASLLRLNHCATEAYT